MLFDRRGCAATTRSGDARGEWKMNKPTDIPEHGPENAGALAGATIASQGYYGYYGYPPVTRPIQFTERVVVRSLFTIAGEILRGIARLVGDPMTDIIWHAPQRPASSSMSCAPNAWLGRTARRCRAWPFRHLEIRECSAPTSGFPSAAPDVYFLATLIAQGRAVQRSGSRRSALSNFLFTEGR